MALTWRSLFFSPPLSFDLDLCLSLFFLSPLSFDRDRCLSPLFSVPLSGDRDRCRFLAFWLVPSRLDISSDARRALVCRELQAARLLLCKSGNNFDFSYKQFTKCFQSGLTQHTQMSWVSAVCCLSVFVCVLCVCVCVPPAHPSSSEIIVHFLSNSRKVWDGNS